MRIAVIVPCFNDGATVLETVESVLDQEPCELVVVDDGSTDPKTLRTFDVLRERGVTVVQQENRGLSAARCAGLAATEAPYVFPLDADDMLFPGVLGILADAIERADERVAAVWGDTVPFGADGALRYSIADELDPWRVTHYSSLPYSALFRRTALEDVGGWALKGGYEDWDLWLALAEHGWSGMRLPLSTLRYRQHGVRMWADAVRRHDEIVAELRRRHPDLYARRRETWRRSREPWRIRALFPLIGALPWIDARTRLRGYALVHDPGHAAGLVRRRLRGG